MLYVNIFVSLVLIGFFVHWKSPLILFAGQFALGAIFRSPDEALAINATWFALLMLAGLMLYRSNIRWDKLALISGKVGPLRAGLALIAFLAVLFLWIQQAGVTDFSSVKRSDDDGGGLASIVDGFLALFLAFSVSIVAFWKKGQSKTILFLSITILVIIGLRAFLGSNRGLFVVPLVLILAIRVLTMKTESDWVKVGVAAGLTVPVALYFLILTTSTRAGVDIGDGLGLLALQLSGGLGNGYSPLRDLAVMDHVEMRGAILPPIMMLAPFYGFIPRVFWPDKPDVGVGATIGSEVFGTGGLDGIGGAGIPISVPAHFEAMLGPGGFAFGILAVALILAVCGALARKHPITIVPLAMIGHNMMGSDLGRLGMQLIILTVALFVAQKWLSFRLVNVDDQPVKKPRSKDRNAMRRQAPRREPLPDLVR
ncbi:hypothetical protein [Aurantiacibacter sp. D1-12]|uniref:hypothetical protein n=1 Tax=Aurantiacibacter sp. D1-12 TaxID=2993658 RepID=UPI00237C8266|nr:hypothetical protein [Aurantiacibacter sp. D1-12]MDE1466894.1 hypothetical protein [Aurantiacibacter sp. D1-12]